MRLSRPKPNNPNLAEIFEDVPDDDNSNNRKRLYEDGEDNEYESLFHTVASPINGSVSVNPDMFADMDKPPSPPPTVGGGGGDAFDMEPILQRLKARAEVISDPVIKFVADVAGKTGTGMDNMILNPTLPLVSTSAKSIQEMLDGSRFPRPLLVALLARLIIEQPQVVLKANGGGGGVVRVKEEEATPLKANSQIGDCIHEAVAVLSSNARIGVRPPNLFAANNNNNNNNNNVAPPDGQPDSIIKNLLDVLTHYSVTDNNLTQWTWEEMPEQSGVCLVKPEVMGAIQTAHEDIKALSASHSQFKLWHLITSPRVRHHFAMMVAGLLNAMPSEIQYPHYKRSVRDNGAVTGSRVSSGIMSQARHAAVYKKKLEWFKYVEYQESTIWREAMERAPKGKQGVDIARNVVSRTEAILVKQMNALWGDSLDTATKVMTGDLYDCAVAYDQAKLDQARIEEDFAKAKFATENARLAAMDQVARARVDTVDVMEKMGIIRERLKTHLPRTPAGYAPVLGRVLGSDGAALVPFAPGYGIDAVGATPYEGMSGQGEYLRRAVPRLIGPDSSSERDNDVLIQKCAVAITNLEIISKRIASWTMAEKYQTMILNLTDAFIMFRTALINVRKLSQQLIQDRDLIASFTEDSRRELVYNRVEGIDVVPVRDYLRPRNYWAEI